MQLDTGPLHHEAKNLYSNLGFTIRDAYYDPGPKLRDRLLYMERSLTDRPIMPQRSAGNNTRHGPALRRGPGPGRVVV